MKKLHLAETEDFSADVLSHLKKDFDVTTGRVPNAELKELLEEVDVFWFRLGYLIDHKVLSSNTRCKVLCTPVTGIDHIDEDLCDKYGIKVICLKGEKEFLKEVRATAEHTILLCLGLMRNLVPSAQDVLRGEWNRDIFRGFEIYKKRVGIVGYGRLGRITAQYFKALGAKVLAYDPLVKSSSDKSIEWVEELTELIKLCDIVSIHVSYSKETHHLFDEEILNHFTKNKFLINTSRGGVIDEKALLRMLSDNKLKGAALDVLWNEKEFNFTNPLVEYARNNSNLLITPHIGGNTFESFEKTERFIAEKLAEYFA